MKIVLYPNQIFLAKRLGISAEQYAEALRDLRLHEKRMKKLMKQYRKKKGKK